MQVKQNRFQFYLSELLYMVIALAMRAVALAPLLFLFTEEESLHALALLSPVLLLFWVLPMRYSFADALVQSTGEHHFCLKKALSPSHYGEKLAESLLHALHVLKWGLPAMAALGYAYYCYNQIDALTLLKGISALGQSVTDGWCAVANFFLRIFGAQTIVSDGGILHGLIAVAAVAALAVLIWLYGAVRNSASRYIWVVATREERSPRTETRRRMRGRRWQQLGVALVNLLLWAPFLAAVVWVFKGALSGLSGQLMTMVMQQSLPEMELPILPLVLAFVLLYLPLLPLRRSLTAAFATHARRGVVPQLPVQEQSAETVEQ